LDAQGSQEHVMAWILIRTFVITPLVLIVAALLLLPLGLQMAFGEIRRSSGHPVNSTNGRSPSCRSAYR
jgi:F0F1-type ATP synthase assembly protein I